MGIFQNFSKLLKIFIRTAKKMKDLENLWKEKEKKVTKFVK